MQQNILRALSILTILFLRNTSALQGRPTSFNLGSAKNFLKTKSPQNKTGDEEPTDEETTDVFDINPKDTYESSVDCVGLNLNYLTIYNKYKANGDKDFVLTLISIPNTSEYVPEIYYNSQGSENEETEEEGEGGDDGEENEEEGEDRSLGQIQASQPSEKAKSPKIKSKIQNQKIGTSSNQRHFSRRAFLNNPASPNAVLLLKSVVYGSITLPASEAPNYFRKGYLKLDTETIDALIAKGFDDSSVHSGDLMSSPFYYGALRDYPDASELSAPDTLADILSILQQLVSATQINFSLLSKTLRIRNINLFTDLPLDVGTPFLFDYWVTFKSEAKDMSWRVVSNKPEMSQRIYEEMDSKANPWWKSWWAIVIWIVLFLTIVSSVLGCICKCFCGRGGGGDEI